jgi:nicotinic acid mononucleotide adenylyltransferase
MKTIGDIREEKYKSAVFTFGRFNPPTSGHQKLIKTIVNMAVPLGADPLIYSSQSQDPKKNPLDFKTKMFYLKKFFGASGQKTKIVPGRGIRNVFDVLNDLYKKGYTHIQMVVGDDRIAEFNKLLNQYNGVKARHGFYEFERIRVVSAGSRDPDQDGAAGMSASKARKFAADGDEQAFLDAMPFMAKDQDKKKLYQILRAKMGIREGIMDLPDYLYKDLYEGSRKIKVMNKKGTVRYIEPYELRTYSQMGYKKVNEEVNEVKTIKVGEDAVGAKNPHYAIIQDRTVVAIDSKENLLKACTKLEGARVWLTTKGLGEIVEDAVPSVKGDQPAKYYSGIKDKKEKESRAKHFAKGADKPDGDPKSYAPAPGDKDAETKPSQYTKKFKQMFGEVLDDAERARIKAQRDRNKDQLQRMRSRFRDQIDRIKDKEQKD